MSVGYITNEQASKIGAVAAGVGLALVLTGAASVKPIVIGVGAVGAAVAAVVKLVAKSHERKNAGNLTTTETAARHIAV